LTLIWLWLIWLWLIWLWYKFEIYQSKHFLCFVKFLGSHIMINITLCLLEWSCNICEVVLYMKLTQNGAGCQILHSTLSSWYAPLLSSLSGKKHAENSYTFLRYPASNYRTEKWFPVLAKYKHGRISLKWCLFACCSLISTQLVFILTCQITIQVIQR
jgi:hypothetical protein